MNRLSEMQAFAETVRCGGFSAAARELSLSPSAVSKLVTRLEERLGVRLLNRTTRRISLTEAGTGFYGRCCAILSELDEAESEMLDLGELPRGVLRVNCSPGFATLQLIPLLNGFHAEYPDLQVELTLTGKTIDLIAEGVDLAIRLGALQDSSLVSKPLGQCQRLVCAAPDYLAQHGVPTTPQQLLQHNCLRLTSRESMNVWKFFSGEGEEVVRVRGNFSTDNVNALYDYAVAGGGVIRLSRFMLQRAMTRGQLLPLLSGYTSEQQSVNLVYPHRRFLPRKVRVFIDYLEANISMGQ